MWTSLRGWLQVDYERMHGMRVSDLCNVGNIKTHEVPGKMCLLLSTRMHAIVLDVELNGVAVVARNVHVAVALVAMKLHWFVRALVDRHMLKKRCRATRVPRHRKRKPCAAHACQASAYLVF